MAIYNPAKLYPLQVYSPVLVYFCSFFGVISIRRGGVRDAGDIVLFSGASAAELRLGEGARLEMPGGHFEAERPTLIELVNDVPGAGQAPIGSSR